MPRAEFSCQYPITALHVALYNSFFIALEVGGTEIRAFEVFPDRGPRPKVGLAGVPDVDI